MVVVGPTRYIFSSLIEDFGLYIYNFWPMMLRTGTFSQDSWVQSWTIFYWAWWVSWAPFVGTFIARMDADDLSYPDRLRQQVEQGEVDAAGQRAGGGGVRVPGGLELEAVPEPLAFVLSGTPDAGPGG